MKQLGLGVMLGLLTGNERSVNAYQRLVGKKIAALTLDEDALHFVMDDGTRVKLFDDGQSCCEHRYMHSDDALSDFVGATFISAEVRDAPDIEDDSGEVHEVAFLVVTTNIGAFTVATHNEHNGYYGGFLIAARNEDTP